MIVGIDLGTTNSLVSAWTEGNVKLIPNEFGEYLTPSVVSFDGEEVIVGKTAKERLITNPNVTFREFKRQMGHDVEYICKGAGSFNPVDLSAFVIRKLISDAEKYLEEKVDSAVISVPAYFDDHQREATRMAGVKAGINVTQLVNEPSAAALSYHIANPDQDEKFIVFDFGGGTLDVTIVEAFANIVEITNISGDNALGGKDFNEVIATDICSASGIDWNHLDKKMQEIILNIAESIKIELSDTYTVKRTLTLSGRSFDYELDRQRLIDISTPIFKRLTMVLKKLMNDAMISEDMIDAAIMVGGSSKMPVVRAYMESLFPGKVHVDPEGDFSICKGAGAVSGIALRKEEVKDIVMTDICPFSLGVDVIGDRMSTIIPKNQTLPASRSSRYYTVNNMQSKLVFNIYQGEKHTASQNLLLDTVTIDIPPRPRGEVYADVRFSYDLNGIFDIDIVCPENGAKFHRSRGASMGLDQGTLKDMSLRMEELKQDPREIPEIKYLLEKSLRMYEEGNDIQRNILCEEIDTFNFVLDNKPVPQCKQAAMLFSLKLEKIEQTMFRFDSENVDLWKDFFDKEMSKKDDDKDDKS